MRQPYIPNKKDDGPFLSRIFITISDRPVWCLLERHDLPSAIS